MEVAMLDVLLLAVLLLGVLAAQGVVGPTYGGDGTTPPGRQGKTGEATVGQAHGKYYESASRGLIAFAQDAAGVATTTSISTTCILCLYNPLNSQRRLAVGKVSLGYFSGTLGAGPVYHCVNPMISGIANPTAPTGGSLLTSYWSDVFNVSLASAPVGIVRTGATVVAPVVYRHFCSLGAALASSVAFVIQALEDLDGEIVLEPGGIYQLQSICAAGSTPKVTPGISWEEAPIVASQG
jgi:hypothetical protein